jgi:hypothetical protein
MKKLIGIALAMAAFCPAMFAQEVNGIKAEKATYETLYKIYLKWADVTLTDEQVENWIMETQSDAGSMKRNEVRWPTYFAKWKKQLQDDKEAVKLDGLIYFDLDARLGPYQADKGGFWAEFKKEDNYLLYYPGGSNILWRNLLVSTTSKMPLIPIVLLPFPNSYFF